MKMMTKSEILSDWKLKSLWKRQIIERPRMKRLIMETIVIDLLNESVRLHLGGWRSGVLAATGYMPL
jgi:hypothetical protein